MTHQLSFAGLDLEVRFKEIKNMHLSVNPPQGHVTVAAPMQTDLEVIRAFAIKKLGWIRRQQRKLEDAERPRQAAYLQQESHYVWGQRYLLRLEAPKDRDKVLLSPKHLILRIDSCLGDVAKADILSKWYRGLVRAEVNKLAKHWAEQLGVKPPAARVRHMKTKWGSCNRRAGSILINTDLGKKPKECLDYVVLHEIAHLVEPTHNERFATIMDRMMPTWRARRDLLNSLATPLAH